MHLGQPPLMIEVHQRRPATEMVMDNIGPGRAGELVAGVAEQVDRLARVGEAHRVRRVTSSITPSTPITGVGRIGVVAGLVVEADIAAR